MQRAFPDAGISAMEEMQHQSSTHRGVLYQRREPPPSMSLTSSASRYPVSFRGLETF